MSSDTLIAGIGSDMWPTPIDSVFDAHHYNDVTIMFPNINSSNIVRVCGASLNTLRALNING